MKKRLFPALLALAMALTMLPAAEAAEGPDYQTVLIAQLEAGAKPSANNLFFGISQWKEMREGSEKAMLAARYAAIRRLDLSDMGLTQKSASSDDLSLLEPFAGLEELDLSTKTSGTGGTKNALNNLDYLKNLPNLRRLDVSGNQLEARQGQTGGIAGLAGCLRLEALDLSGNKRLGGAGSGKDALAPLAGLPGLRELDLSGTGFNDSDVESVRSLKGLAVLDVSDTGVKNLDLSGLRGLSSLTANNLTLDSLDLPAGITDLDLTGTKLKVKQENEEAAAALMKYYGDSGLKLVNGNSTNQEVYTVTVADAANGTAEASVKVAAQGTKVKITDAPDEGYARDSVVVSCTDKDGKAVSVPVTEGGFTMPKGNVTVTVTFMPQNVRIEYNTVEHGSVAFDRESLARGERISFVTDLGKGYKVRQITAKIGRKTVPVYRSAEGVYCFDMPRVRAGEALVFTVAVVETVTVRYSGSGQSGGRLTLSGLEKGRQYVCQMSEAGSRDPSDSCTIVTFTAQDSSERLEVRGSAGGYVVSLWKYDSGAASVQDLTNVIYEVPTNR